MSAWVLEIIKGIGRLWIQPLFYYGILLVLFVGWRRVKKERSHFHIRVYDWFHESKFFWRSGLGIGVVISFVTVVVGVAFPRDAVMLLAWVTILLGLTVQMRLLSPAYTIGLTFFVVSFLARYEGTKSFFTANFPGLNETNLPALAILLALLLMAEAWLILRNGAVGTSPQLTKSKRGFIVGEHWAQRLWFVPILLPVTGDALVPPFSWWPLFPGGNDTYSLMLVPFFIGFSQHVQGMNPHRSIHFTGKRVMLLALVTSILAVVSYWYVTLAIAAAAVAFIAREWFAFSQHVQDRSQPPYFSQRANGLVIVGILPKSKAEKMALQIGEVIVKVNGMPVKTEEEFYRALQRNRAFCKLEVLGENGEVRFVQGALYEDEHHELGLLFVQQRKKWASEAV
ncbi:PDZ domain-containing protein [Thermaerobacillus caldiproteolyticus]|uniref:PDZ domain-containing protein n=1 Tax=Thermaerobacillus caldiproteolyticus TaxID=247480 RepID=UPI00188A8947|nr:PDZ domain-containing protein [Anoxybacillus caldiproteolyticus]QPA30660.1 PDZ domain-containing protein [Anoxybacillus caldiproteolyticus]